MDRPERKVCMQCYCLAVLKRDRALRAGAGAAPGECFILGANELAVCNAVTAFVERVDVRRDHRTSGVSRAKLCINDNF